MIREQMLFPLIREICKELKIDFIEEPTRGKYGVLVFENGRKFFLKDVNLNLNCVSSMRVTKNKALTSYFLEKFGYSVPDYTMVYSNEKCKKYNLCDSLKKGIDYAHSIGFPIMVKLNDSSQGRGIYKVYTEKELETVSKSIFRNNNTFQIQKFYNYNDFRIVILDDKVLSAYQRIPLHVIGDGTHTINQLLEIKQNYFIECGRDTIIKKDDEILENLNKLGYNDETILPKGEKCVLRNISNLSAGGESIDLSDKIHKDYKNLCISIAKDFNLTLCGIDIMCDDICKSMNEYVILEINSSPGLDNYVFSGLKQQKYVKALYREIVLSIKNKLTSISY